MQKSILITGASSGIGKAVAHEMARKGYAVALAAPKQHLLDEIRDDIAARHNPPQIISRALDVTDHEEVFNSIAEIRGFFGRLDIVFANAGIGLGEKVGSGDFDKARKTIEVNLIGAMATVDAAISHFLAQGGGHVVGTSSIAALRGFPRSSAYSASKAGLAIYLEAVRAECLRKNIDVTVLYPGYIDTPLNQMLPSRPFLISVEKGAAIISRLIEKRVKSACVPAYPWAVLGPLLKILPLRLIAKM
ncbi:MAG: SDR family oxidoreductase [Desulfobacterales bacterium]